MAFNPLGNTQRNFSGEPEFKKVPPDSIHEFRGIPQTEEIVLPEKFQNRKCTDIAFVIILLLFALSMYGFTIALCFRPQPGDHHDRDTKSESRARGEDFRGNPYDDEPHSHHYPRAENEGAREETLRDFIDNKAWICTMIAMPLVGFAIMMLVFVGLRFRAKICFWILTGIDLIVLFIFTGYYWYKVATSDIEAMNYIFNAILYTFCIIFLIGLLICLRKRLPLIFATYEEALKAIFRIPALLLTPLLTMLVVLVSMSALVYVPLLAVLRGRVDGAFWAFVILSFFKLLWILPFVSGSQCMVVAFAIATYYFTRDKSNIRSPYCRSLYAYFRFHTGTVAAGALIIAIITMLRAIVEGATNNAAGNRNLCCVCIGICCLCCMDMLQEIVEYMTKKAYIMTAIHGKSLCKSGKRAMRLLWTNLLDTIAVDKIGGLAMSGAVILIIAVSVLVGFLGTQGNLSLTAKEGQKSADVERNVANLVINGVVPFFLAFILTMLITGEYMAVLSVAIQTIFLCFCEDKEINDGSAQRPYYMSQTLLNVIQKAFNDKLAKEEAATNKQ